MDYLPLPHDAGLAGSFLEFTASVQPVCVPSVAKCTTRAQPSSGVPTRHTQSLRGQSPGVLCLLPLPPDPALPFTLPPSCWPPCSLNKTTSTQSSLGENPLTHIHTDYVLTPGGARSFKRLPRHKRHKGTTKLSLALPGWNLRVRGVAGWRGTLGGSGSQGQAHPRLGHLILAGCPGHAVLRA